MDSIIDTYKKTGSLHHACLIEGENEEIFASLCNLFENEMNFSTKGNPDFWHGEFETFGIGDGRTIKEMQSRKPMEGSHKIFVIIAKSFTTEAQNSLLKVFEEPTEGTHFFIIIPNADILLPTLRSRMFVVSETSGKDRPFHLRKGRSFPEVDTEEFLKSGRAGRLSILKDIIEEKNKNTAISFLNELEQTLYKKSGYEESESLKEILKCKKYLNGRAPSVKMILEHISTCLG